MAVQVKASSSGTNSSIVLPAGIVAGDFIIVTLSSYNTSPYINPTNGWNEITPASAASSYNNYQRCFWKIAAGNESSTTLSILNSSTISAHTALVITGHSATGTVNTSSNSSSGSTSNSITPLTPTVKSREIMITSIMSNTGNVPTFTTPSGYSEKQTSFVNQNYQRMTAFIANADTNANITRGAFSVVASEQGAFISQNLFIAVGNENLAVTSQSPSNYEPIGSVSSTTQFSWTYTDNESNTQYKYEISYREAGTTGAYTTVTSANGVTATSHTFAANTFVDGKEYEWRLRLDDNQGGGWSPYYTAYFTAGTSKWTYGPQITSSSSTSVTTTRTFATYDFESGVQGWQNNNFFGTYADCTFTNSTTRPKTGTRSMEITWPTTAGESRLIAPTISGFTIGKTYRIESDLYVPAGSPNPRLDPFLQTGGRGGVVLDKDSWVSAWCEFEAVNESITFAVVAGPTTSGQKVFMDNFRVIALTPEPGNYQLSVRTSDVEGFGPWSAPSNTFAVRSAPVAEYLSLTPQRVGSNITVNWKYRDVDSQAQTKYKIRYRKK